MRLDPRCIPLFSSGEQQKTFLFNIFQAVEILRRDTDVICQEIRLIRFPGYHILDIIYYQNYFLFSTHICGTGWSFSLSRQDEDPLRHKLVTMSTPVKDQSANGVICDLKWYSGPKTGLIFPAIFRHLFVVLLTVRYIFALSLLGDTPHPKSRPLRLCPS